MRNIIRFLLIVANLFVLNALSAQGWLRTYGEPFHGRGDHVFQNSNGTFQASGYISFEDLGYNNSDYGKLFQFNEAGDVSWTHVDPDLQVAHILPGEEGEFLIAGSGDSDMEYSGRMLGAAFTDSGDEIWKVTYGDGEFSPLAIVEGFFQSSDGNYLMHGGQYGIGEGRQGVVYKINLQGGLLWEREIQLDTANSYIDKLIETENGEYFYAGKKGNSSMHIGLLSANGDSLWNKAFDFYELPAGDYEDNEAPLAIKPVSDGFLILGEWVYHNLIISGNNSYSTYFNTPFLAKVDLQGNLLYHTDLNSRFSYRPKWVINDAEQLSIVGTNKEKTGVLFLTYDGLGNEISENLIDVGDNEVRVRQVFKKENHYELIAQSSFSTIQHDFQEIKVIRIDEAGNLISITNNVIPNVERIDIKGISTTLDDGYIITGNLRGSPNDIQYSLFLARLDENGVLYDNQILGTVFKDNDFDCVSDTNSVALNQWLVSAEGETNYYGITNAEGEYSIAIDTGDYLLSVQLPNEYWEACDSIAVNFSANYDTLSYDFGMQPIIDCPFLEVDIATALLRRCFQNKYLVQYCNTGTIAAQDAYIEVNMDPFLTVDSTSIPIANQLDDTYTFDIGKVAVGACDQFTIYATVDCDSTILGQTHCVEAHIFPDAYCLPTDPDWSGASIAVDATCEGDSVIFVIENIGTATTAKALDYVIIVDDVILRIDSFTLEPLEVLEMRELAAGATLRLEAEQEAGHPGNSMPSVSVEGCALNSDTVSIGYISQFGEDDGDPFISIDCRENQGSYDPNDKLGFPRGRGAERLISATEELEYIIRFQNTGTDTAFRVAVLDTLPEFLDPGSIRLGASSHPYSFNLAGPGILRFDFINIELPFEEIDELGSNGFVKFKIDQKENNLPGTIIQNRTAIYFDFNDPVITEYAKHQIEKPKHYGSEHLDWCAGDEWEGVPIYTNDFVTNTISFPLYDSLTTTYFNIIENSFTEVNVNLPSSAPYNGTYYDQDTTLVEVFETGNVCDSVVLINIWITVSGTNEHLVKDDFRIFPNPFYDYLNIVFENPGQAIEVVIFDVQGKIVQQQFYINEENIMLLGAEMASGFYMLQLNIEGRVYRRKLIKG